MSAAKIDEVSKLCENYIENEKFQEGLHLTEKSLRKYPKSAKIIAYLALFLEKTKKHDEALAEIKTAIMTEMGNADVWRIQGLIYRSQGDYLKSLQSMTMAYKKNSNDENILSQLYSLTLFLHQYKLNFEYASCIVKVALSPANALKFAYSQYVNGDCSGAMKTISTIFDEGEQYTQSEMGRFYAHILLETKQYEECLKFLDGQKIIIDNISILESKAKCYLNLNKKEELMHTLDALLKEYPDNGDYFEILENLLSPEDYMKELFRIKDQFKSNYAKVRILELMDKNDEKFRPLLTEHIIPLLNKASPAIFATIEAFDSEKLDIAIEIAKSAELPISCIPALHIMIAQIYNSRQQYDEALEEIEKGISQNPTVPELYVAKIDSLSKSGRNAEALESARKLAELDPADKGSNRILVKNLYRNGKIKTARKTAAPFSIRKSSTEDILFKNEDNKIHFRAARSCLRIGKIDDGMNFYKDVLCQIEEGKNGFYNFFSWGFMRIMNLHEIYQFILNISSNKIYCKAFVNFVKLLLAQNKLDECKTECNKIVRTKNDEARAYLSVVYAKTGDVLLALKNYIKLPKKYQLISFPSVDKLVKNVNAPDMVKEIVNELYKPLSEDANHNDPQELLNKARGLLYVDQKNDAEKVTLEAAKLDMSFNMAVDLYLFAKVECRNEAMADDVAKTINKKYPKYEIKLNDFEDDDPHKYIVVPEE
ncbi:TPR Domain containing protein [Trichomonas vaginalis G3]|uniref:TPR Domain containing protein n=1 Tax=Trichomonas vaginalis (strain ATCC PRA-98 / G3) TaxID=412133 RepID=A2EQ32_TRIV3|nr:N-terminal peptidyl-methionine acetylation [Trichomonas vaginalis G3]EAY05207.1 TPR Domain containing protein [Trichomonas vaginalis G3]KAI5542626.1 N-terminal peptidyl-methionine acetylation [Trichomonas vaginalis G3]|eukprot:XP_001317430.1 TPR Domain containing protein [Trichomonas vaginalis G3]